MRLLRNTVVCGVALLCCLSEVALAELTKDDIDAIIIGRKHPRSREVVSQITPNEIDQVLELLEKAKLVDDHGNTSLWPSTRIIGILGNRIREFDRQKLDYDRDKIIGAMIEKSESSGGKLTNTTILAFTDINHKEVIEFARKNRSHDELYTRQNSVKLYESLTNEREKIRKNRAKRPDLPDQENLKKADRHQSATPKENDSDQGNKVIPKLVYIVMIVVITTGLFWYLKRKSS